MVFLVTGVDLLPIQLRSPLNPGSLIPSNQNNKISQIEDPQLNNPDCKSGLAKQGIIFLANDFIEKPYRTEAPSNLAIASHYVFTPDIFEYLDQTPRGKNNEIQITDAMRLLVKEKAMYGLQFEGTRYDIGNKLDFIKTNIIYGLQHEEIGVNLRKWLLEYTSDLEK